MEVLWTQAILTVLLQCPVTSRGGRNEARVPFAVRTTAPGRSLCSIAVCSGRIESVWLVGGYLCRAQVGDRGSRGRERKACGQEGEEGSGGRK